MGTCDLPEGDWLLTSMGWFRNDLVALQRLSSTIISYAFENLSHTWPWNLNLVLSKLALVALLDFHV